MSISLPTNKKEKHQRLRMLVKQGSITIIESIELFADYCRLYNKIEKINKK